MKCKYCKTEDVGRYQEYCGSCSSKLPNCGVDRRLGEFELSMSVFLCPTVKLTSEINSINGLFYKDVFDKLREQVDAMEATVKSMVDDDYEWKQE